MKQHKKSIDSISMTIVAVFVLITILVVVLTVNTMDRPRIVKGTITETDTIVVDTVLSIETYQPTYEEIEQGIIDDMALAFAIVESGNNVAAWNKKEDAVGCLQIRPVMVREANNCMGEQFFTYEDRWDRNMSYYMFEVVQRTHNPELDIDQACDVWNPNCPRSYRDAVKTQFFLIQFKKMNGSEWVDEHMDSIVTMLKEMNIKPIDLINR